VSALGHLLEQRGLATTVIALVLPQVVKTRPPRALMTPFMLGRPLGEPNDAPFQRRVLLHALALLTRTDGPVILEHFTDDNPSWFDRQGWQSAAPVPPPSAAANTASWHAAFNAELALVLPVWERFKTRFGRTSVGLAGQSPNDWAAFATSFLDGALPTVPLHDTAALALRFLIDDIKALYGEAAQADGGAPAARQIDRWFWRDTVAGQLLLALRLMSMASPNSALKTVGGRFFVPMPFVPV
jgi:hypothetical protein